MRKNWGAPHRVTEELAAQFWAQRGLRVHPGGWVCTDAFQSVRPELARAPTEVLPGSAGASAPRTPTSSALYPSHSTRTSHRDSLLAVFDSVPAPAPAPSQAPAATPKERTASTALKPPQQPSPRSAGKGCTDTVAAATRLNELCRAAREEGSAGGTPPLCEGTPATTGPEADAGGLLGYVERQVTPRLDVLTSACLKLEGRLDALAAELAKTHAEQRRVLHRLGELSARVGAPPTPVRHPLTHRESPSVSSSSSAGAVGGASAAEKDEAVHQLDLLLSSARGGECRLESLAERLQALRDTLTGRPSTTEPKAP